MSGTNFALSVPNWGTEELLDALAFCRSYDSFEAMQQGVSAVLDHLGKYHSQLDTLMTEDFHVLHPQDYPECCAASTL